MDNEIEELFAGKSPMVYELYALLQEKMLGLDYKIEVKKTSLHLTHGAAFLGVHPKKNYLDITIVSDTQLQHSLIKKSEQVSKSRWHNDFRLLDLADVDDNLLRFIREAYELQRLKQKAHGA